MINSNHTPKKIMPKIKGAYIKASATVEAAIVIPMVIFGLLVIMQLLQIVAIETKISEALYETARRCASYGYIVETVKSDTPFLKDLDQDNEDAVTISNIVTNGVNIGIFYGMFIDSLGFDFAKDNGIIEGNAGLVILRSEVLNNNSKIDVTIDYCIKSPFSLFNYGIVHRSVTVLDDAWLGADKDAFEYNEEEEETKEEEYVYITENGEVYHKDCNCSYLTRNISSISSHLIENERNSSGAIYYPCSHCKAKENNGTVYYTQYGTRYHSSSECSELERDILRVPLSSVPTRRPCSKCGG